MVRLTFVMPVYNADEFIEKINLFIVEANL